MTETLAGEPLLSDVLGRPAGPTAPAGRRGLIARLAAWASRAVSRTAREDCRRLLDIQAQAHARDRREWEVKLAEAVARREAAEIEADVYSRMMARVTSHLDAHTVALSAAARNPG